MNKSNSSNCVSSMSNSSSNNNSSQGATSGKLQYTESDDEGSAEYCEGGYHPVEINEIYNNRYRIEGKLGWGHFSTVWIATDLKSKPLKYVAIKIHKGAEMYADSAKCEISYLKTVKENSFDPTWVELKEFQREKLLHYNMTKGVVSLIDNFEHIGPNGTHVCMVFEFMGPNLLSLIKHYDYRGVPLNLVRKIATHVLIGLQYLHDVCKIIHSDVKPENVLVSPLNNIPKPREEKQEEEKQEKQQEDKEKPKKNNSNENDKSIEDDEEGEEDEDFESNNDKEDFDDDEEEEEEEEEDDEEADSSVTEIAEQLENIEWKTLSKKEKKKFKKKKKNFFKKERWKLDFPKKKQGKGKKENTKRECNVKNAAGEIISDVKEKQEKINDKKEIKKMYNNNNNNNDNCEPEEDTGNVTNEKKINQNEEENEDIEDLEKKIKELEKEEEEAETEEKKYGNCIPPYMKHKLKPRNSDPSLLTSYTNVHALQESLLKKPYHYNNYFLFHPEKYGDSKLSMFLHRLPNDYIQSEKRENSSECEYEDDEENLRNEINKFPMYCEMFNHLMHPEAVKLLELYKKSSKNKGTNDMLNGMSRNINTHKMVFIETSEGPYRIRPYDSTVYYHEKSSYKICDLGNSLWIDESRFAEIQTRQYRSPEVILKCGFNETADIWSFACMVFELVTGDFLFNPQKGEGYDKNEEHLSSIMELLGDIPKHMIDNGYNAHKYFNKETYELRNITDIKRCELHKVLKYKYKIPEKEINPLCSFLLPMLSINPETRATASVMLQHPWLNMVTLEEDDHLYINGREEKESISASSEEEEDIPMYQSEENNERDFEELDHFGNSLNSSDQNLNHTPENSNIINYRSTNVYYSHNNFRKAKECNTEEESEEDEEEIIEYDDIQQQQQKKKKKKKQIFCEERKKDQTTFYSSQPEQYTEKNEQTVGMRNHDDTQKSCDINPQLVEHIIKLKGQKNGSKSEQKDVKKFNGISPVIGKQIILKNKLKNKNGISASDDDDDDDDDDEEEEEEEEEEDNGEDSEEDSDDENSDDDSNKNSDNDFDENSDEHGEKFMKKKKEDKSEGDDEDEHNKFNDDKENEKEKNEKTYTNNQEGQYTKNCKKGGLEKFKFTKFIKKPTEYVPNKKELGYQYNQVEELDKREQENYFFEENEKDKKIKKKKICIFTKKINVFNE